MLLVNLYLNFDFLYPNHHASLGNAIIEGLVIIDNLGYAIGPTVVGLPSKIVEMMIIAGSKRIKNML